MSTYVLEKIKIIITRKNWLNPIENESECQEGTELRDSISDGFTAGEGIAYDIPESKHNDCFYYSNNERNQIDD